MSGMIIMYVIRHYNNKIVFIIVVAAHHRQGKKTHRCNNIYNTVQQTKKNERGRKTDDR